MNPDKTLVDWAERDLQCFGAVSREEAAVALEMWSPMRKLRERSVDAAAEVTALVLDRFPAAEPPNVPGRDWLPSAAEVASYNTAIAESLREPAPVKALPAVEASIPAHAYHPFAQGAFPGVCSACCEGRGGKLHVAETVAALDEPIVPKRPPWPAFGPCAKCGVAAGEQCVFTDNFSGSRIGDPRPIAHRMRPLVDVVPEPTAEAVDRG